MAARLVWEEALIAALIVALGVLVTAIGLAGVLAVAAMDMQGGGWVSRETLPFWAVAVVGVAVAAVPFL